MRILVFSDTHGHISHCAKILKNMPGVDMVLHAGDYLRDGIELSRLFPDIAFHCIKGNNDSMHPGHDELTIDAGGKKILITHGHLHRVKYGMSGLQKLALENDYDLIVFGHTHDPLLDHFRTTTLLNPGTMGYYPRTYAVVEIENDKLRAAVLADQ